LQVTKGIPQYIRDAKHTPIMKQYLIRRSAEGTGREKPWDETIFESIDWRHYGEAFKKLSTGRRIQIAKYTNDLLPTKRRLQTLDNRVDGRCFACQHLWEDTTHILTCSCDTRCSARAKARAHFQHRLSRMHAPDVMNKIICESMDSWLARRPVVLPMTWNRPRELIHREPSRRVFHAQQRIGRDQFFRGRIAKAWHKPIGTYYKLRQPGDTFTADQLMRQIINELWIFPSICGNNATQSSMERKKQSHWSNGEKKRHWTLPIFTMELLEKCHARRV
jgi:hypothetical protein